MYTAFSVRRGSVVIFCRSPAGLTDRLPVRSCHESLDRFHLWWPFWTWNMATHARILLIFGSANQL